jgi:hypothetical protein
MQDTPLLSVTVVTDDETGMYQIGDLDYSIPVGLLEDYLVRNGHKGYKEILFSLGVLSSKVTEYYHETQKRNQRAMCGGA